MLGVTESYTCDIDLLKKKLATAREQNRQKEMRVRPITEQEKNLIAHMSAVEAKAFPGEEELNE